MTKKKEDRFVVVVWCFKEPLPIGEGEYFPIFDSMEEAEEWAEALNGEVMSLEEVIGPK